MVVDGGGCDDGGGDGGCSDELMVLSIYKLWSFCQSSL